MSAVPDSGGQAAPAVPAVPAARDVQAPSLRRRMACWVYEGMLLFAVAFFATWLFSTLGQMRSGIDPRRLLLIGFLFVTFGIYFSWFWVRGQTLAMKTWHIRVVDRAGRPLSQGRALLRYLCSWLWFLPPLAALAPLHLPGRTSALVVLAWVGLWALASRLHPQRQFWHDALAGTRLVTSPPLSR
ncbi:MAG TPA: RDD family protein [Ramlibacter sp.]|nr:RDD family protein [Ramlibacter sp.]